MTKPEPGRRERTHDLAKERTQDRRRARGIGLEAEFLASVYLRVKGWRILARGYIAPGGEIDIVARRGDTLAFIEVKSRATLELALMSIDARKQRRISRAARSWIGRHGRKLDCNYRGDAVLLAPWRFPRHVAQAFELDL